MTLDEHIPKGSDSVGHINVDFINDCLRYLKLIAAKSQLLLQRMKVRPLLALLATLACIAHAQLPPSTWEIRPFNSANIWREYGLQKISGSCSWALKQYSQNLQIKLYDDDLFDKYLQMTVYFNHSVNKEYPYYNSSAHTSYSLYQNSKLQKQTKSFDILPHISLYNNTLTITETHGEILLIKLAEEVISSWVLPLSIMHLAVKVTLLFLMMDNMRRDNKLSMSFVYTVLGWELQTHLTVMTMFANLNSEGLVIVGSCIGLVGWGCTLLALFYLPRPAMLWEQCEGLMFYLYECGGGFLFSSNVNIFLFSLILLFQVRFNILMNLNHSISTPALLLYLTNIIIIFYPKGCPVNLLRHQVNYPLCVAIALAACVQIWLLQKQRKQGPYLCLRQIIKGKDYNYYEDIMISEGDELIDDVCSICLQPIAEQAFLQNVRVNERGARVGTIMKTPCNHRYHPSCLKKWLEEHSNCPLDNQQIPPCYN